MAGAPSARGRREGSVAVLDDEGRIRYGWRVEIVFWP